MIVTQIEKSKGKPEVKTKTRSRPDAVLIEPFKGLKFADILKNIRTFVKPEESEAVIPSIKQTRKSGVLLKLDRETTDKASFSQAIEKNVGSTGTV